MTEKERHCNLSIGWKGILNHSIMKTGTKVKERFV